MELTSEILSDVVDSGLLSDQIQSPPLAGLIANYEAKAKDDTTLPAVALTLTGAEFKALIAKLPTADKIELLYKYSAAKADAAYSDPHAAARRLRYWLIRVGVVALAPIPCMVVAAMMIIGVQKGAIPDNPFSNTLVSGAVEILKLIFSNALGGG